MAKKGLTLDEKRAMIKALFNSRNAPEEEVVVDPTPAKPPKRAILDEDEVLERELVKRKARDKKRKSGYLRPRGK